MRRFFKLLRIKKREMNNISNVREELMPDPTDIKKVIWEYYD